MLICNLIPLHIDGVITSRMKIHRLKVKKNVQVPYMIKNKSMIKDCHKIYSIPIAVIKINYYGLSYSFLSPVSGELGCKVL